jgi:hypothetical protein
VLVEDGAVPPPDVLGLVDAVEGVELAGVFAFLAACGVLAGVEALDAGGGVGVA